MTQKQETETMDENSKYKDGVNRNARLIVRNVSFKATEEALREHFSPYGTVEEVKLLKRPDGKLVGCGFVHFTQVPMANKAMTATNKKPFLGRPINVAWAVTKHKYDEKLQTEGAKKQPESAPPEEENKYKKFKKDVPETAPVKNEKPQPRVNRNARLIVRNISFKSTEETLKEHFAPYGEILEVKLLKKPDGKLVGCAFVHFKNVPMAKKALLNTNMKPFLGRPISVDWAVAKDKYMKHVVEQQLQLQEDVKKEDSDSDDDGGALNVTGDEVKAEVKSESEDSDTEVKSEDDDDDSSGSDDDDDAKEEDDDEEEADDDDDNDVDMEEDNQSETDTVTERQRIKLNDAEDGCTVFITNLPFSVDNDQLRDFAERTGRARYALVCVDKLTEHSKGSGFVKFERQHDADAFLALPPDQLKMEGQVLQVKPALKRENLQTGGKKQAKDSRNLYLVKEGVVVAGTKAAVGVSASDMTKRLALERSKTQMLKNLNRFVSRYRLVVSNLPPHFDDSRLRAACARAAPASAVIGEARVMRDLRAPVLKDGRHPSKGYGFVMFNKHEDALMCLRKLNNNPDIFDKNNRPIVSFSIEDRTALNARKKRLEKSIANNPHANKTSEENEHANQKGYRKRKNMDRPDESTMKRGKFDRRNKDQNQRDASQNNRNNQNQYGNKKQYGGNKSGQFVRPQPQTNQEFGDYTGLTSKEGTQHKMRSNHKLKLQANVHRQTVKAEKKMNKHTQRLKMAAKERVKQPKQKVNKNPKKGQDSFTERKVQNAIKESSNFSDLVSKYKSKLAGNSLDRVKAKWYEN